MANPQVGIDIVARATGFDAEFRKISASAQQASSRIQSSLASVKTAAAGLGLSLSAAGFAAFVRGAVDAADKLNDLSKATGVGAVTLGGIGFAAQQAGTDIEGVAKAFGKFNIFVADAQAGNEKAVDTFRKLGISFDEIKSNRPEELFAKVATAFSGFEDDANKAAGANLIFGKTFASVLPLLDEGGDSLRKNIGYYQRYSGVTDDLVRASDQFNDSMTKLKLLNQALANQLAANLLPAMQKFVEYLVESKEKGDGFKGVAGDIADALRGVATVAAYAGTYVTGIARGLGAAAAAATAIISLNWQGAKAIYDELQKEQDERLRNLQRVVAAINDRGSTGVPESLKDTRGGPGASGKRKTPSFGDAGGGTAKADADEFGKALQRIAKLAADADVELAAMFSTQEITAAQKALAELVASDAWGKFTEPQRQALTARYQMIDAVQRETAEWKRKREETEKEIQALQRLQEEQQKAVQAFTANLGQYADDNSTLERSIALVGQDDVARQKLAETIEYERLKKQALLADDQAGLAILEEQFQKRISLIEQLAAATERFNEVQKYNKIFADSFADAVSGIVDGTKSIKEAFRDMERAIVQSITRIAAQKLADSIFGVGTSGGPGNFFASLFGGSGGGGGFDFGKLFGFFGSSGGGSAAAIGNMGADFLLPGFAVGTPYVPRDMIARIHKGERIVPAAENKREFGYGRERSYAINQTINVMPGATYETSRQAARMAADRATTARRRG